MKNQIGFLTLLGLVVCLPFFGISQNIALNKPARASSDQSSSYSAAFAVDGNSSTRWSSNASDAQWIYIDLSANYNVSRVKITWEAAYAKNYTIDVSNDGVNWTTKYWVSNNTSLINDNSFSGTGRYVRINCSARATSWGYSIFELEVYGSLATTTTTTSSSSGNLALNRPTTVSSVQSGTSYTGNLAVDGNSTTRWSSNVSDAQWIYVDLGANYNVSRVKVTWEAAYAKNYTIDVSNDGVSWTTKYWVSNNTSLTNDNSLSGTGRYVRINCTARGTSWGYSIFELEVYGSLASTTTTTTSPTGNLALNKSTKTSSVESGSSYTGNLAVDGNSSTRWSSAPSDAQWIYVDLGASYSIARVKVIWEEAYAKNYTIDVSNDASNWTTIYWVSNNSSLTNDNSVSGTGRYVRISGTKRATSWGYSIYELEVYGTGSSQPSQPTQPTQTTPPPTGGGATATPGSGKNYYFSSTDGDDSRSSTQAQSSSTPWRSLSKLNSFFSSLQPGDNVWFKRGDTFYGSITFSRSGSSSGAIFFGAYGSGNRPVITGLSSATGWTSIGSNRWESSAIPGGLSNTAMTVLINGTSYPMGRWPNSTDTWGGFRKIGSHGGSTSITDANTLPSSPNWAGATVVIRKKQYVIEKGVVTSQSGNTLNYSPLSNNYGVTDGYGYFIENNINTLDQQNEWYYNSSTKKLDIYSTTSPSNVQIATVTTLFDLTSRSYLSFDNLNIKGSNGRMIIVTGSSNITFTNCDLNNAGADAIYGGNSINSLRVEACNINNSNHAAITTEMTANNTIIKNNNITNSGVNPGMLDNIWLSGAVYIAGSNTTIQQNTVTNSGYIGIRFGLGSNVSVKNNFVNTFGVILDEGAGIYTFRGSDGASYSNRTIDGNIIINGLAAVNGKSGTEGAMAGIQMDNNSQGVNITNNSISNISFYGIFLLDAHEVTLSGNTVYDCGSGTLGMIHDVGDLIRNVNITNNKFVMKNPNNGLGNCSYQTTANDLLSFGTCDYNIIATPINDVNAFFTHDVVFNHFTLSQWQSFSGKDRNSKKSPKSISTTSDLRFEYNATSSSKTISLGASYIDINGTSYASSITLAPYTSAVLIRSGATTQSVATAEVMEPDALNAKSLVIYPNPVKDNFVLQMNNEHTGKMDIRLFNQAGALVRSYLFDKQQTSTQVSLSADNLPAGVYFVHVQIGTWSDQRKLVKIQ